MLIWELGTTSTVHMYTLSGILVVHQCINTPMCKLYLKIVFSYILYVCKQPYLYLKVTEFFGFSMLWPVACMYSKFLLNLPLLRLMAD